MRAAGHAKLSTRPPRTMRDLMRGQSGGPHRTFGVQNHGEEIFVPGHFTPNPAAKEYIEQVRKRRRIVRDVVNNAVKADLDWTSDEIEKCQELGLGTPDYLVGEMQRLGGKEKEGSL